MTESRAIRKPDALALVSIAVATLLLYGRSLRFWWTADDPAILRHVFLYGPSRYLFDRDVYQGFSKLFFFPGLLLSFDADLRVFGFRPVFFYLHQLASVALAAGLLYLLMRRWNGLAASLAAALLFLVGAPLARVVSQLGVRHYVDGLVFALAATLCFLQSVESPGRAWRVAAGALALAAMACKEIYVPLPFLLLALPQGSLRERVRRALPVFVALGLYVAWRVLLLGGYLGGYTGESSSPSELLGRVPILLRGLSDALLGAGGAADEGRVARLAATGVAAALAASILLLRRKSLVLSLVVALLVLAPLLPVSNNFQARYAFLPWAAAAMGAGWAAHAWRRTRRLAAVGVALVILMAAPALLANRKDWARVAGVAARSRVEAQFFFHESVSGDVLRLPVEEGNYYTWLAWLRTEALHGGRSGRAVFDDLFFCRDAGPTRVFAFSDTTNSVEMVAGGAGAICEALRARLRTEAPLSVTIAGDRGVFEWDFGPWRSGSWAVLIGDDLIRYDLLPRGRQKPVFLPEGTLTIRYESPEGWLTFSPPLPLRMENGSARVTWSR